MTRLRHAAWHLAKAGAVGAAVAGCLPAPATDEARDVAALYAAFLAVAAVVALIVIGATTWAVLRYRGRPSDPLPPQTRGNTRLEIVWTALPALAIAGLFVITTVVLARVDATDRASGAEIEVTGFRWGWSFRYPEAGVTVSGIREPGPTVVVPVGEPVLLRMTAADVEHAFYVPRFLFKRDLIPGRVNTYQFTVTEPGTFAGQCAEFCGVYHARMPFTIEAVPRAEYDAWLAAQGTGGSPAAGPADAP